MPDRPNILLLHTDQQRFDTIAALGFQHMMTPNLDRLVREGTAFTRAYSSNPVCMPARHDLITGASARHHGYYGNSSDTIRDYGLPTVPRLLTESGYQTIAVGKMHFQPAREHHGFAHMYLMEELPACREDDAYLRYLEDAGYGHIRCQHGVRPLFYHVPQPSRVPAEHHGSAWVAHKTIDLLRTERDRPFFIFASWVGPHPPYYLPDEYLDAYRDRPLPAPCPMPEGEERHAPGSPENLGGSRLRRMREAYFGAVSFIDQEIGRILDVLESEGLKEDTLVLFMTDHGEMLGDRNAYQKHVPYEGSAHIPLLARGSGFAPGAQCDVPATTWDVSATILEAAGIPERDQPPVVGRSLRDLPALADREAVFHHTEGRERYVAAVSRRFKFVHWYNGGEEELYDLQEDPWEQQNLLPDRADDEVTGRLRNACIAFERDHGIVENVRDGAFVDFPYEPPQPDLCSLYPEWSSFQLPKWMNGYSEEDLAQIAREMRDCVRPETVHIYSDRHWRRRALQHWKDIGGDPEVYERLFAQLDKLETQHRE